MTTILQIVVSVFLAFVAWQQWRTSENKRKQDLFEKRWDYYKRLKNVFLENFVKENHSKNSKDLSKRIVDDWINHYSDEALFLFGEDIEQHVKKQAKDVLERVEGRVIKDPTKSFRKPFEKYLRIR